MQLRRLRRNEGDWWFGRVSAEVPSFGVMGLLCTCYHNGLELRRDRQVRAHQGDLSVSWLGTSVTWSPRVGIPLWLPSLPRAMNPYGSFLWWPDFGTRQPCIVNMVLWIVSWIGLNAILFSCLTIASVMAMAPVGRRSWPVPSHCHIVFCLMIWFLSFSVTFDQPAWFVGFLDQSFEVTYRSSPNHWSDPSKHGCRQHQGHVDTLHLHPCRKFATGVGIAL